MPRAPHPKLAHAARAVHAVAARVGVVVAVAAAVVAGGAACAPASTGKVAVPPPGAFEACPIEPERFVVVEQGTIPLVLTSTHAGDQSPLGCDPGSGNLRDLGARQCTASLDLVCESGPCRAGGADQEARQLTFTILDDVTQCLGGRPSLALTEVRRNFVDMNRDANDSGGLRCAMQDSAALPYWEAFHRTVEGLVAHAVDEGGDHALLIDLHTYNSLPAAPPPAMMVGTGSPVGFTTPHLSAEDPELGFLFGATGLRAKLLEGLHSEDPKAAVFPASADASLEGLFLGRYMVHRYSRRVDDDTKTAGPAIDAIQLEMSSGLRDHVEETAQSVAAAICATFGERLRTKSSD